MQQESKEFVNEVACGEYVSINNDQSAKAFLGLTIANKKQSTAVLHVHTRQEQNILSLQICPIHKHELRF